MYHLVWSISGEWSCRWWRSNPTWAHWEATFGSTNQFHLPGEKKTLTIPPVCFGHGSPPIELIQMRFLVLLGWLVGIPWAQGAKPELFRGRKKDLQTWVSVESQLGSKRIRRSRIQWDDVFLVYSYIYIYMYIYIVELFGRCSKAFLITY